MLHAFLGAAKAVQCSVNDADSSNGGGGRCQTYLVVSVTESSVRGLWYEDFASARDTSNLIPVEATEKSLKMKKAIGAMLLHWVSKENDWHDNCQKEATRRQHMFKGQVPEGG